MSELTARTQYITALQDHHIDFQVQTTGLIINKSLPWIGASPDGTITCACHGRGVLEIKCPFTLKDQSIVNSCNADTNLCLMAKDNVIALKPNHKYMAQVQVQMRIAEVQYGDFVVWSPTEMFIQRIQFDEVFFNETYSGVEKFIKTRILPELLGKYYTVPRPVVSPTSEQQPQSGCYCGEPAGEPENVVICASKQCKRGHFHRSCLRLTRVPKVWKCYECRKIQNK